MKYHIVTLGCPKNAVDSEGMSGILAEQGHDMVDRAEDADVVIVNTCSFIAAARDETLSVLREIGAAKPGGQQLIAAGCMAESHSGDVGAVAGVDAVLSTREWMRIGELVAARGFAAQPANGVIPLMAGPATPPPAPAPTIAVIDAVSAASDDLGDTLDYGELVETCRRVVEEGTQRLLEAVAGAIADEVLGRPGVERVTVRVRKPAVPLDVEMDYAQVELQRVSAVR